MATFRIGNQSAYRARTPREPYHFALRHDFTSFEWYSDRGRGGPCEDDFDARARADLREEGARRRVRFSVHAPYAADPTDPAGAEQVRRSIDFAGDIGAAVVNFHLFPYKGLPAFVAVVTELAGRAAGRGVRLSIENSPDTGPGLFNEFFHALPPATAPHVGMCLDMGHANLHPATRNDYLAYVDQLGAHVPVIHWHAHENRGDRDSHLPLFTGPAAQNDAGVRGLVARLAARGFDGAVVLECWPSPESSFGRPQLVQSRDRLAALVAELTGGQGDAGAGQRR